MRAEAGLSPTLRRLHRHSRSSLLVLGGSPAERVAVVRSLHEVSPVDPARFHHVDCRLEEDPLGLALRAWLGDRSAEDALAPMRGAEHGTLFLDRVGSLGAATQHLLLDLARRMQAPEPLDRAPFRLAAGDDETLLDHVERGRFSEALFDSLDKIRVDLAARLRRGAA
jgi:sigma54-dependent transcription regulator